MPELPDVVVYIEALERHVQGRELRRIRLVSSFLLRSVDPPIREFEGLVVRGFRRLGKRIVFCFDDELFLVLHLMIAGRLRWRAPGAKPPGKRGLAAFDFENGTLLFTEEGTKKRASLYCVRGEAELAAHDRGGLEVLASDLAGFKTALARENRTLKRALTDPRLFSGIGNAYSDEILHRAKLSPAKLTKKLVAEEIEALYDATRQTLSDWTQRLRIDVGEGFPEKVTAFREGMAVHGRYREACPVCQAPVQRILYAENEANYCARCQTDGRLLADRALSRLLKKDWPRTLDELESRLEKS
jgi:formamidopyrimidine-DNA glycosylase